MMPPSSADDHIPSSPTNDQSLGKVTLKVNPPFVEPAAEDAVAAAPVSRLRPQSLCLLRGQLLLLLTSH